jgi:uncharacterized membrane protein HdeD (DUF308 family)
MDLPANVPVAVVGALLIVAGIVYKLRMTAEEQDELHGMRRRHQGVMSEFGHPLSEREAASAKALILFLLSPLGLIVAGVVVIFLSIRFL